MKMYDKTKESKIRCRDGTVVYYRQYRNSSRKPTLIFIHGLSGNHTVWKFSMDYFLKRGYPVMAFDLRGHGYSTTNGNIDRYMIRNMCSDLHQIIIKENIRDFYLVGHSLGGMIAMQYDKMFLKKPKGMIIIGISAQNPLRFNCIPYLHLATPIFNLVTTVGGNISKHIRRKRYPYIDYSRLAKYNAVTILVKDLIGTPLYAYWWTLHSILNFDIRDYLPKMDTRILCISGTRDSAVSWKALAEIDRLAKDSRFVIVDRADHMNPIRMPGTINPIIEDFVR
jgi:pimeloyl-ACP methyl ester carboxylesterase